MIRGLTASHPPIVRRTTDQTGWSIKGQRPRAGSVPDESSRRVDLIEKVANESAMVIEGATFGRTDRESVAVVRTAEPVVVRSTAPVRTVLEGFPVNLKRERRPERWLGRCNTWHGIQAAVLACLLTHLTMVDAAAPPTATETS